MQISAQRGQTHTSMGHGERLRCVRHRAMSCPAPGVQWWTDSLSTIRDSSHFSSHLHETQYL